MSRCFRSLSARPCWLRWPVVFVLLAMCGCQSSRAKKASLDASPPLAAIDDTSQDGESYDSIAAEASKSSESNPTTPVHTVSYAGEPSDAGTSIGGYPFQERKKRSPFRFPCRNG